MDNGTKISASEWNRLVNEVREAVKEKKLQGFGQGYNAALQRLDDARDALRTAFKAAKWGANGAAFVTRSQDVKEVWVNRIRMAMCTDDGWVTVYDPTEAKVSRDALRTRMRDVDAAYKERLERVGRILWTQGVTVLPSEDGWEIGGWRFATGQQGGIFLHDEESPVSAPGALKRAQAIEAVEGSYESIHFEDLADELVDVGRQFYGDKY